MGCCVRLKQTLDRMRVKPLNLPTPLPPYTTVRVGEKFSSAAAGSALIARRSPIRVSLIGARAADAGRPVIGLGNLHRRIRSVAEIVIVKKQTVGLIDLFVRQPTEANSMEALASIKRCHCLKSRAQVSSSCHMVIGGF